MKHLKKFNESKKPRQKKSKKLDYQDMMDFLEEKYKFESRGFTGIPSQVPDRDRHFYKWCDKHNLGKKDSKGNDRGSSQEFFKMYKSAEDGERVLPPYMDYWHYLCEINETKNGSYIYIPKEVDDSRELSPQKNIQNYKWMLDQELKLKNPDKKHIKNCEELIRREEEELKNPKKDPWSDWKQQITDLIFKEFGEFAEHDMLEVWVEW